MSTNIALPQIVSFLKTLAGLGVPYAGSAANALGSVGSVSDSLGLS